MLICIIIGQGRLPGSVAWDRDLGMGDMILAGVPIRRG